MYIHSVILARGGSKGIKKKNLILIKNKPLIYWSIKRSLQSKYISHTWVSSDDNKILKYSKMNKAKTIRRPVKFSNDKATSESAWIHAVNRIKKDYKVDLIVGIQPTSPIREKSDFDKAIKFFKKKKFDSLFSSNVIQDLNTWSIKNNALLSNYNFRKRKRRQDIKNNFLENGSFYIFNAEKFLKKKNRLFGKIGKYDMSKKTMFQIDDEIDLKIIKSLI